MKCGECKDKKGAALDIGRPLELYDGRWCCPRCKKDIFPQKDSELQINAENNELFVRSEEAYYKWLTSAGEKNAVRFKYLDKALNLCSEAAFALHPEALMRMGYYYENGYMDSSKSLKDRRNAAYRYYDAVCSNEKCELTELKEKCANKRDALGEVCANKIHKKPNVNETNNSDFAFSVWRSCFDEERAPLFAVFRLSASEAEKFLSGEGEFSVLKKISRDTYLKIAQADANGGIGPHGFETKKNPVDVTKYLGNIPSDGIYMMIFNSKGRHRYLKKHQITQIAECLDKDDDEYVKQLICSEHYNSSVFYDDDIYIFKDKHKSVKKAVEKFIKDMWEEK